jgi:glycosyltransferase involved in cell wall biosynthesis
LLGWVDEADLPVLYAEALCFVYPSEYEGFGLQLCEAMAVGCPVLAANATCLAEVLGDGGDTFSLDDIGKLTDLLEKVAFDPLYYEILRQRAVKHSCFFGWSKTAQETLQVYRKSTNS